MRSQVTEKPKKCLGQALPTTLATLYTVPSATGTIVSAIVVCNQDSADASFRLAHAIRGAADDRSQYLFYDTVISGNQSYVAEFESGIPMGTTDVLRGSSSTGRCSFSVYGQEYT